MRRYLGWDSSALWGQQSQLGLGESNHEPIVHRQYDHQPTAVDGKVWRDPEQSSPAPLGSGEETTQR